MGEKERPLKFANRYALLDKETNDRLSSSAEPLSRKADAVTGDDPLPDNSPYGDVKNGLAEL